MTVCLMALTAWTTFLEVCRLGSLSAAAAELGYTQSAVSRQIAALERTVGVPLFERRSRGVVPTQAGEAFRHHARVVVNEAGRAIRAARDAEAGGRSIVVGATPSTAAGIVPAALRAASDAHPGLSWTLITDLTDGLEARVAAGELDVAVVTDAPPGLPDDPRLRRRPLVVDEMCVIVPRGHPAAAGAGRTRIEDFAWDLWVEDNEGSARLLRTAAGRAGFSPILEFGAADLTGKTAMVAAGLAVALVPSVLLAALRSDVVPVRLVDPPTRGLYVSQSAHARPRPVVETLVEALSLGHPSVRDGETHAESHQHGARNEVDGPPDR